MPCKGVLESGIPMFPPLLTTADDGRTVMQLGSRWPFCGNGRQTNIVRRAMLINCNHLRYPIN